MQVCHVTCLERHRTEEHGVEYDTSAPNVAREVAIAFIFEHFWCYVGRSTALLGHLLSRRDKVRHSKVADFDITKRGEQDVVKLDIAMEHVLCVAIGKASDNLAEEEACCIFFELSAASYVCKKVTTATHFHYKNDMLLGLKRLIQSHYVTVARPAQDIKFLHHFALRLLLCQELLVD